MDLNSSWKRTAEWLEQARAELPDQPFPGEAGGSVDSYIEFMECNELELAMDELDGLATTNPTTVSFWMALYSAASEMGLDRSRDRYRRILAANEPLLKYRFDDKTRTLVFPGESIGGSPDPSRRCERCGQIRFYSDEFDAYFCAVCNRWQEKACGDPHCEYCAKRPASPLRSLVSKRIPPLVDRDSPGS